MAVWNAIGQLNIKLPNNLPSLRVCPFMHSNDFFLLETGDLFFRPQSKLGWQFLVTLCVSNINACLPVLSDPVYSNVNACLPVLSDPVYSTVNACLLCCCQILVAAMKFFLGSDEDEKDNKSDSEDDVRNHN